MTCIVGLVEDKRVYIGGDSCSADDSHSRITGLHKVFMGGNHQFVIGYTSSFRMGQILQHHINYMGMIEDATNKARQMGSVLKIDERFMVTVFVEEIRKKFEEFGFSKIKENEHTGGTFLVGVAGNLYQIDSDYQVNHYKDGFTAVGHGYQFALGSLYETFNSGLLPRVRITKALAASAYFDPFVREPFVIEDV